MSKQTISTRCCIGGGGPAGIMLGYLLARAGVDVLVLEKHADFLRDFRGDTVHPSTLELMHELNLLDEFLKLPHQPAHQLTGYVSGTPVTIADFSHLRTQCRFIAFVPQWDFLEFLASRAQSYPSFRLLRRSKVTGLIKDGARVVGITAETPDGPLEVRADLVIGADGRDSKIRTEAGLPVKDFGAPMDVLWFPLSRQTEDPQQPAGRFDAGRILVMINRTDYWQCGFVVAKGSVAELKSRGLEKFRSDIAQIAPFVRDRVSEIQDWDDVKLLTVKVDRLLRWHQPGLLCIGDAAHAMSPIGGVGINLAIQDAVATSNILVEALRKSGAIPETLLHQVQARREFPTRVTQRLQIILQNRVIRNVLTSEGVLSLPLALKLLQRFPYLQRIPARIVGVGVRPEHIRTLFTKSY